MTQDLLKFRVYRNEMTYTVMEGLAGYNWFSSPKNV